MNRIIAVLLFVVGYQSAFGQGALSPTAAPAPTMKSLAQIEPRTPISALPATITVSGSYYVTTNLTGIAGSTNGITILVSDVTLDLSGFTLLGVAGSGSGITVPSSVENLAIRNGGLDSWGGNGIATLNAYNSQFDRLHVSNCAGGLLAGSNCLVSVCTATGNSYYGINVGNNCIVKDSAACGNSGSGTSGISVENNNCIVKDCTAIGNSEAGIFVGGNNNLISGNNCSANGEYGIQIFGGSQNRVDGNTAGNNAFYGIYPFPVNLTNSITRNFAPGNGSGGYGNYTGNSDYAPTGTVSTATNPWTNF